MTKLCECGCGQPAPIAKMTNARLGHVKGQPVRFVHNHHRQRATCTAPDCGRDAHAGGLCTRHYRSPNVAETQRRWQANNPEAAAESRRRWQEKNPDYARQWYLANRETVKERSRARHIRATYGLTVAEYDEIIARGCAICGLMEGRICLDHDHATGKVRGALCDDCNTTLGRMRDDPARLRAAADYLEKHSVAIGVAEERLERMREAARG